MKNAKLPDTDCTPSNRQKEGLASKVTNIDMIGSPLWEYFRDWLKGKRRKRLRRGEFWSPFAMEVEFGGEKTDVDWNLEEVLQLLNFCYETLEESLGDELYFNGKMYGSHK